jgi:SAM-dependent methyltransferase
MDAAYLNDLRTRDRTEDLPLIIDLAHRTGPNILELGCGTGRVLRALEAEGFRPVGIDASIDALRIARKQSPELRLECQKMERFEIGGRFDLILLPFGGFDHVASLEDRLAVLRRVVDHSHSNTMLYIDIWPVDFSPEAWLPEQAPCLLKTIRTNLGEAEVFFSAVREPLKRLSTCRFTYRVKFGDGSTTETSETYSVSPITADELRLSLHLSGFRIEGWQGDYTRTPYEPTMHQRLVVQARPVFVSDGGSGYADWPHQRV